MVIKGFEHVTPPAAFCFVVSFSLKVHTISSIFLIVMIKFQRLAV